MNDDKINQKIKKIEFRLNQLQYCQNNVKSYYFEDIKKLKSEIEELNSLQFYEKNKNKSNVIDLHGMKKYFIDNYFNELIFYKMDFCKYVKVITGKGSLVLYNNVKKMLDDENLEYQVKDYTFVITLY